MPSKSALTKIAKTFMLNFILGGLLIFALAPFYILPLLIVSLSGLLWQISTAPTLKSAIGRSYAFGFGYYLIGLSWIGVAFLHFPNPLEPNKLLGISLAIPAILAIAASLSLFFILLCILSLYSTKKGLWGVLNQAAIWTFISFLQGHLFTGFPWNPLAISFTFHPILMQPAAFLSSYGLSFIAACLGYSLYGFYGRFRTKSFGVFVIGLLAIFSLSAMRYYYYDAQLKKTPEIAKIRAIQTGISLKDKWDYNQFWDHMALVEGMLKDGDADYDAAILGETALPFLIDQDDANRLELTSYLPANAYLLIGANQLYKGDYMRPQNTFVALNNQGQIIYSYAKTHLVPFGEYTPKWLPFDKFIPMPGIYVKGNGPQTYELPAFSYGPNICYEGIFSGAIIDEKNKPDVIINVAIDGWYGNTHGPRQHAAQQLLRAVEESIPLIRVTDNGVSFAANALGKIEHQININQINYFDYAIKNKELLNTSPHFAKYFLVIILLLIICSQNCYFTQVANKH